MFDLLKKSWFVYWKLREKTIFFGLSGFLHFEIIKMKTKRKVRRHFHSTDVLQLTMQLMIDNESER